MYKHLSGEILAKLKEFLSFRCPKCESLHLCQPKAQFEILFIIKLFIIFFEQSTKSIDLLAPLQQCLYEGAGSGRVCRRRACCKISSARCLCWVLPPLQPRDTRCRLFACKTSCLDSRNYGTFKKIILNLKLILNKSHLVFGLYRNKPRM